MGFCLSFEVEGCGRSMWPHNLNDKRIELDRVGVEIPKGLMFHV